MLLYEYNQITGLIRKTKTQFGHFACDVCGREYDRPLRRRHPVRDLCGPKCRNVGKLHTEEWKLAMSERMQGENNHYFGRKHSDEIRNKICEGVQNAIKSLTVTERKALFGRNVKQERNPFFKKQHSLETRKKMSESRSKGIVEGRISCGPRGRKGNHFSQKTSILEKYDSFYEFLRMKLLDLDENVIYWTKKHNIRIEYELNSDKRIYVPDFFIQLKNDQIVLEEIKGYEQFDKLSAKLAALQVYCLENNFQANLIDFKQLNLMVLNHFGSSIANLRREI